MASLTFNPYFTSKNFHQKPYLVATDFFTIYISALKKTTKRT